MSGTAAPVVTIVGKLVRPMCPECMLSGLSETTDLALHELRLAGDLDVTETCTWVCVPARACMCVHARTRACTCAHLRWVGICMGTCMCACMGTVCRRNLPNGK